jgi:hypothetical protein
MYPMFTHADPWWVKQIIPSVPILVKGDEWEFVKEALEWINMQRHLSNRA